MRRNMFSPGRGEGDESRIAGGATAMKHHLAARLLDELQLQIVLGEGERLLENVGHPGSSRSTWSPPRRTHLEYRVGYRNSAA